MILPRRKLLVGAGAAAAVIAAPHVANAAFAIFQASKPAGPAGPSAFSAHQSLPRLIKPTGFPKLDGSNPLNNGLLYYGFDTGLGEITLLADCAAIQAGAAGHGMFRPLVYGVSGQPGGGAATTPIRVPALISTRFGTGFNWPGFSAESTSTIGASSWVWDGDQLRSSLDLYNKPIGAGFTITSTFVPFAVANPGIGRNVIFGRTANGFNEGGISLPNASICLELDTSGNVILEFYTNGAMTSTRIASSAIALNQMHTAVGICQNTSGSPPNTVATVTLYLDGVSVATSSGQIRDTFGNESTEGQIQFGCCWHVYGTGPSGVFNGQIFDGSMYSRAWNAKEAAAYVPATAWGRLKAA